MNITLPPELEQFVHQQLKRGNYASVEDVVLAGIRLLEVREQVYEGRFEELQREVAVGLAEANKGELTVAETVFQRLHDKLRQRSE
ncbi:type II toxin-antitoxin system ParD family antitoxin [Romeria aff. gracilis LEGE 07310]|uniref:Type II toxin-antitoxin system ParD family antitoxin n=1 Tax=Vasconcelosia minhoensis LEGE 07310 TaxID=915328 RepID=A0A8J7DNP3_9CYAN|nr:type II toxin-antitoxin system ParD family antitoxin [Romeria gracilis]MBE9080166.1 type II toxin-antitoxin system ParD family antitoxin [Romeria aff. gracilis LEGE 07310]